MSIIDNIKNLTFGKGVSVARYDGLKAEKDMTDDKLIKIAAYDGTADELSLKDLKAYEDGLIDFEEDSETYLVEEEEEEEEQVSEKTEAVIKNNEKVKQDDQGSYIVVSTKGNNCLLNIIKNQYGEGLSGDESKELISQIMNLNPHIYNSNRKGTGDVGGIKGSGTYLYKDDKIYLPNGNALANAAITDPTAVQQDAAEPVAASGATPAAASDNADPAAEKEVPEKIKDLVVGIEDAINPENWTVNVTDIEKLMKNATPDQMYMLNNYWNETKGMGISEQIQKSLDIKEDDKIIESINEKIAKGSDRADAQLKKAYKAMPKASRDSADRLSALLIENTEELSAEEVREVYGTILKLYNGKTTQLDEYWQMAYGKTLSDTIIENGSFEGQNAEDIVMVIKARNDNPTRTRSTAEMKALKENLEAVLSAEPVDREALSNLLIGENISKNAMEALDKYCRGKLGTTLAAAVYTSCDTEGSEVLKGWLENYKIVPSTSKKAQERGEDLAQALDKDGGWAVDKDAVYKILGNYKNMNQEQLLNLNDYWVKTYGHTLVDEMKNYPEFQGQEQTDLLAAIQAKLSGKSVTRTQQQMSELKTNLKAAIDIGDTEALTNILIGENISKNAMEGLDRYCKKTYGNKSLIEILKEQNLASDAMIKWLQSYGLK